MSFDERRAHGTVSQTKMMLAFVISESSQFPLRRQAPPTLRKAAGILVSLIVA